MADNQAGQVDPEIVAKADRIAAAMSTPVAATLPSPADPAAVVKAEAEPGFALPPALRRVYLEVADGGFGPGGGLMSLAGATAAYARLRRATTLAAAPVGLSASSRSASGPDSTASTTLAAGRTRLEPEDPASSRGKAWNEAFGEIAQSVEAG